MARRAVLREMLTRVTCQVVPDDADARTSQAADAPVPQPLS
ncbi:hypothetical protein [Corynebacterium sp. 13CS0277]|nr:hypothetical protein [Corynebacterium sp. 13CS0277]